MIAGAAVVAIFPVALVAQPAQPSALEQFARLQGELRRTHDGGDTAVAGTGLDRRVFIPAGQTIKKASNHNSPRPYFF
jgi:hypothetical protein